ncbi:unnamed protein product [Arctogadus glacialis]
MYTGPVRHLHLLLPLCLTHYNHPTKVCPSELGNRFSLQYPCPGFNPITLPGELEDSVSTSHIMCSLLLSQMAQDCLWYTLVFKELKAVGTGLADRRPSWLPLPGCEGARKALTARVEMHSLELSTPP